MQEEKQIALLILCREADKENAALQQAQECPTNLSISLRNLGAVVHLGGARRTVRRVQELKKAIEAKVQVDLNDACTPYHW